VTRAGRGARLAVLLLGLTASACSRANLDAITHGPSADGGGSPDAAVAQTCPTPALAPGDTTQTLQSGGNNRNYFLHVPSTYDGTKPVPLILDFHGLTTNGARERANSPYPAQTDPEGVIMAFPSGMVGPSGAAWNVGPCCVADVDDVAFARQVVAEVETMACIDAKRVYAVGFSMGGGMAHYLGCHAADVFAGVAPASFDLLQENVADCKPARAITEISFRGTADTLVPYDGGSSSVVPSMSITFLGAQGTFKKWAELDQCTGSPSAEDSNGCSTYSSCQGGVEVVLCSKQGGGQEAGNAAIAWPILKRHPMP
jgi:polyhydroxybutyrate depolymerase